MLQLANRRAVEWHAASFARPFARKLKACATHTARERNAFSRRVEYVPMRLRRQANRRRPVCDRRFVERPGECLVLGGPLHVFDHVDFN
jgi:hypothetical protein